MTVTIDDSNLTNIADAIREKNSATTTYKPSEMAAAIRAIESGGAGAEIPNRYISFSQGDGGYDDVYVYRTYYYNGTLRALVENITPVSTATCAVGSFVVINLPSSSTGVDTDGEVMATWANTAVIKITETTTYVATK